MKELTFRHLRNRKRIRNRSRRKRSIKCDGVRSILFLEVMTNLIKPVFEELYQSVATGEETRIVLEVNSAPDYKEKLEAELREMRESEMWQAGAAVRSLRPENWKEQE